MTGTTTPLVNLATCFPLLQIDMKYATADNITGKVIYPKNHCLLHEDAAAALQRSIHIALLAGFSLVIYDAYRPPTAQALLWEACPDPRYVADVTVGSHHCRGTAVDVTLMDNQGRVMNMGTGFDDMQERSHAWHPSLPHDAQRHRLMLNAIMAGGGFTGIETEWWHFELPDSIHYPLLDHSFD